MNSSLARSVAFSAALLWLAPSASATEFGATHAVFEKATKLKKVRVSLLMSALDQSDKGDQLGNARRLGCAVIAFSKASALPVKGAMTLRFEGTTDGGSAQWQGRAVSAPLDERGTVIFDAETLSDLASEALDEEARPARFRVDFKGGKGKKVTEATLDCVHEPIGGQG